MALHYIQNIFEKRDAVEQNQFTGRDITKILETVGVFSDIEDHKIVCYKWISPLLISKNILKHIW